MKHEEGGSRWQRLRRSKSGGLEVTDDDMVFVLKFLLTMVELESKTVLHFAGGLW